MRIHWEWHRDFETGVDRGVYFPNDGPAEPWNGLSAIEEKLIEGAEQVRYVDGVKTYSRRRPGEFAGRIEAYTYPQAFDDMVLSRRKTSFGFSYRVTKSNGYLIHLVYNCKISPEGFSWEQNKTSSFVWNFTTTPVAVPGDRVSAHLIVDTRKAWPATIAAFESVIYGSDAADGRLPSPDEVLEIFEENSIVRVTDHGDGTYTISGPDDIVAMLDSTSWKVDWFSAVQVDSDSFTVSSL